MSDRHRWLLHTPGDPIAVPLPRGFPREQITLRGGPFDGYAALAPKGVDAWGIAEHHDGRILSHRYQRDGDSATYQHTEDFETGAVEESQ